MNIWNLPTKAHRDLWWLLTTPNIVEDNAGTSITSSKKFELLSDEDKKSIKAYKTWGKKKFMGKEFMGQIRSTFLVKDNKILHEWRNVRVKDHAKEVLNFLKSK